MNQKPSTPSLAQAPPEGLEDWQSPIVLVNGNALTVEQYYKNPEENNKLPFTTTYLNSVCQDLAKKTAKKMDINLPLTLSNLTPQKEESPK